LDAHAISVLPILLHIVPVKHRCSNRVYLFNEHFHRSPCFETSQNRASPMQLHKSLAFLTTLSPIARFLLSFLVLSIGFLLLVFRPLSQIHTYDIVQNTAHFPLISAATLADALPGSEVVIEGQIAAGSQPQFRSFIAYSREDFVFKRGWTVGATSTPPFVVALPDGQIRVANADYVLLRRTLPVEWRSDFHLFSPTQYYRGLVQGSHVVVVGRVIEDAEGRAMRADYVSGASRTSLAQAITNQVDIASQESNQVVGWGLILGGGWAALIFLLQAIHSAWQRRHQ
jgi:hypothetical protein